MKKIAFYDTKPYDKTFFTEANKTHGYEIIYLESKLNARTGVLADGADAVVAFVNDDIDSCALKTLKSKNIGILAMRSAGYNNVDMAAAKENGIKVVRVPDYSPYAIAEHTMALLLALVRKIHKAYNRTREYNFSLNALNGFDLHGKTVGVIGTGKIGGVFIDICKGFGMKILAYDPYPSRQDLEYVSIPDLCARADIISLHCPLTKDTFHLINRENLSLMKNGVYIINTSRGALIDTDALLEAIRSGKVGAAGLDVYEEESEFFYEDLSNEIFPDEVLALLITMPNVLVTSHQAFLTNEALSQIAKTTLENLDAFFQNTPLKNEIQ